MLLPTLAIGALSGLYGAQLYRERRRHAACLHRIPLRIHVNGTRGKSTVTRLIAACLRAGGIRTVAKTTGTTPRLILEDGSEQSIIRHRDANIAEQMRTIEVAARRGAEAIVLECMAVTPEYQWVSEHDIVQAQIGVLTNVRLDHTDIMGPTLTSIASCLCNTIPGDGTVVTAETRLLNLVRARAALVNSRVLLAVPDQVTARELEGFPYATFADNVAIALEICRLLGIDRQAALAAMQRALPDPGTLYTSDIVVGGKRIHFINALAANDVMSTRHLWDSLVGRRNDLMRVLLFCARRDRPARNVEFAHALADGWDADLFLLIGRGGDTVRRYLLAHGLEASRVHYADVREDGRAADQLIALLPEAAILFAAGNIVGLGETLAHQFIARGCHEFVRPDAIPRVAHLAPTL